MQDRQRGFEVVSLSQWLKDAWKINLEKFQLEKDQELKDEILRSYEEIKTPLRATSLSAGYDVFTTEDIFLPPGEDVKIPLGWKAYMLPDEKLVFHPRSGLGFKYLRLANTTGVVDSDYYNNEGNEGHCWIKIRNEGTTTIELEKGTAIAQCIFEKYLLADGDSFTGQTRLGGFGSTG
jgi:dUTP pyrophosphatase